MPTRKAAVEPDSVLTTQPIARKKKKGLATLSLSVPNGGTLVLGGILVKVGGPSTIADKSTIQLTVKAKGKKAKQLKKTGKVGVKPLLTFTPTFGAARTQAQPQVAPAGQVLHHQAAAVLPGVARAQQPLSGAVVGVIGRSAARQSSAKAAWTSRVGP